VNPLLLPPRLLFRALDDLHTIALAASRLEDIEQRIDNRLAEAVALGERIAELGEGVDGRLAAVLDKAEQVDARLGEVTALGDRVEGRIDEVLGTAARLDLAARDLADSGRQLAEALPILARAAQMAEPLEGAVERLGRIVDRLPGGARGRGSA
jgi:hypothetical protein